MFLAVTFVGWMGDSVYRKKRPEIVYSVTGQNSLARCGSGLSGVVSGTTVLALLLGRFRVQSKKLNIELKDNAKKWIKFFIL